MSKKQIIIFTTVLIAALCGCGKGIDITSAPEVSQELPTLAEAEGFEANDNKGDADKNSVEKYRRSMVCDRWADSGMFIMYTSEDECYDFFFNYSIPQIIDDTADAKYINNSIENLFGDMHETMQKASKEGKISAEEFGNDLLFQTNYECYWNDSIASIVIYSTGYFDNDTRYNVYNYDFSAGKQLSNEDIFAIKGITGEMFVENMRRAAAYSLDMDMQQFFECEMPLNEDELWYTDVVDDDVQHMYGDYLLARAKTIHIDNINEQLPLYLDEQGELQVITRLYNMGMYGEITSILSPVEWVNNCFSELYKDTLEVISKDDGIYLIIYREEWSDAVHDEFPTFDFAKEYKIEGLCKNYIDAKISWVGNGNQPYILLLSDDGMISYVDVWEGIASEYFCAVEPLWGLENIKSFSDESEYRIVAENNDGKLIDVEDALYMMLSCKYNSFEKNMLNLRNVARYSATVCHKDFGQEIECVEKIGFTDDKYQMFVRESYGVDDYVGGAQVGYITFEGMNENGMVYCFSLVGEEGELRGTMAMNVYSSWDEEYVNFIEGAEVTWLGGLDIFESKGNKVVLDALYE